MSRLLAISPHLDDAVFSAGGTLAGHAVRGDEATILTCFAGNVDRPEGFALACQLDKGLGPEVDYMALRRAEDIAACAAIGARALHWDYLEAPHRGYHSARALFEARLPQDDVHEQLARDLHELLDNLRPDIVYAPYGIGSHVDHLAVRQAVEMAGCQPVWWEDYPYALREKQPPAAIRRRSLDAAQTARKLEAVMAYDSQLAFQFGSREKAAEALRGWNVEGFANPAG